MADDQGIFYSDVLVPLFFNTLNNERPDDIYQMPDPNTVPVRVPFLNGGLFDRDALDEKASLLTFTQALFTIQRRPTCQTNAASSTS
ncbi:MAG: hypothetical protein IPK99_01550 [Flavobacteriales bacterium]|nr:hypothetical protein [Flavobacteriales bacterium]